VLVIIVDKFYLALSIDSGSEIKYFKTISVLFKVNLIVTLCKILEYKTKAISIVKELGVNELQLLTLAAMLDLEQFYKCLLITWASLRKHPFVVKFSSNICLKTSLNSKAVIMLTLTIFALNFMIGC
jgi:hypothetical protein